MARLKPCPFELPTYIRVFEAQRRCAMSEIAGETRSLFAELMEGVEAMKRYREGTMILRTHEFVVPPANEPTPLAPLSGTD
jgi:hypothetical protein